MDFVALDDPCYWYQLRKKEVLDALKACSLVARSWLPRSRYHLFRILGVQCSPDLHAREALLKLLSDNPAIRERVEAICARGPPGQPTLHWITFHFPRLLSRLRHLRLSDGVIYLPSGPSIDARFRQFTTVTELSLNRITFHRHQDLRRLISAIPHLEKLALFNLRWAKHTPSSPPSIDSPYPGSVTRLRLKELIVHAEAAWITDCQSTSTFHWLTRSGAIAPLAFAFLHLDALDMQCVHAIANLTRMFKSVSKRLILSGETNIALAACEYSFDQINAES